MSPQEPEALPPDADKDVHLKCSFETASASDEKGPNLRSMERSDEPSFKPRRPGGIGSNFIKAKQKEEAGEHNSRKVAIRWLTGTYVSNFMALVVLFDSYCTCADIDARAIGEDAPAVLMLLSDVCLALYTLELVLLVLLKGFGIFAKDTFLISDAVVILCGFVELIISNTMNADNLAGFNLLRTLRFARIIRLLRLLRKTRSLRELQKLVTMMATCLKALAWSFLFCFVIMTIWAMLMVEVVNPLIQELDSDTGIFDDCLQCMRATSSVMNANLLLFKTVIAGDSWGLIAVPVIEHYPGTAIIFVGSLLTIVFGVLNLIVAVVVDTFAEARERDVLNLAEEMERNHENDKKFLQKVFDRIDEDGSGELTLEELVEGARKDPEFQSRLRVMDIDEVDLQQLFEMIDADGSGSIEAAEFIAPLSRWVHESKTAPRFIKYNMLRTMQQQEELYRLSHYQFTAVSSRLDDLTGALDALQAEYRQPIAPELTAPLMGLDRERPETAEGAEETRETNKRRLSRMSLRSTQSLDEVDLPELERQELSARFDIPNELDMEHPKASRLAELAKCQESERSAASQASAGGRPRSAFAGPFKAAMDSLERSLLSATEQALKQSMAMVEMALQDELHQVKRPTRSRRPSDHDAAGSRSSVRLPWSSLFPGIPLAMRADEQELKRSSRTQSHVRAGNRSGRPSEAASPPTSASPAAARDDGVSRSNSSKGFRYLDSDSLAMPVNRRAARHSIAGVHLQLSRGF